MNRAALSHLCPVLRGSRLSRGRPGRRLPGLSATLAVLALAGTHPADASSCGIANTSVTVPSQVPEPEGSYGTSVGIDGEWLAVGAPGWTLLVAGRVEMFRLEGGVWTGHSVLVPSNTTPGDKFGVSVRLDRDTLLVGAYRGTGLEPLTGSASVFRLVGDEWIEEATLIAPDGAPADAFGFTVALFDDWAVIGSDSAGPPDNRAGAAYVFRRDGATRGSSWVLDAQLVPLDGEPGDSFGSSVQIDGETIVVGARGDNGPESTFTGSIRIFERHGGQWTETATITTTDTPFSTLRFLGQAVVLRDDRLVATASPGDSAPGTALSYTRLPDTGPGTSRPGRWSEPRLVLAKGGLVMGARQPLAMSPSGAPLIWCKTPAQLAGAVAVLHDEPTGWAWERQVHAPVGSPVSSSKTCSIDEERIAFGRAGVSVDGVLQGFVFVADIPPRDRDFDALADDCEIASGLTEDCDEDGVIDDAQRPYRYIAGPPVGQGENYTVLVIGGAPSNVFVLNHFVASGTTSAPTSIHSIGLKNPAFIDPSPVVEATALVYLDPDGDGNPRDAILLSAQPIVIGGVSSGVVQDIPLDPVVVGAPGTSFFVGFIHPTVPMLNVAVIKSESFQRAATWIDWQPSPFDPDHPSTADLRPLSLAINPGSLVVHWTLDITANLSDCVASGRLDACEIAEGVLVDLDGNGIPDLCEDPIGDIDGDGETGGADLGLLIAAWGDCLGTDGIACAADLNHDGVVNSVDLGILLSAWKG